MKKIMYPAVAALVALTACTKTELTVPEHSSAISFEAPVVAPATKAATGNIVAKGEAYKTDWKFSVSAMWSKGDLTNWSDGTVYMDDVECGYDRKAIATTKGTWAPEYGDGQTAYYWPKTGKLSFLAYSPSSTAATFTNDGVKFENYTVSTDCEQPDLMYSEFVNNVTKSTATYGTTYEGVQIKFHHALSSVLFKAYRAEAYNGTEIVIKSIVLSGVKNNGTYDDAVWAVSGDNATYSDVVATDYSVAATTATSFATNDLLVMPQAFESNADAKFHVVYTIKSPTAAKAIEQEADILLKDLVYTGLTGETKGFEAGKQYTYVIKFTLDKIYFSPEVTDWTEVTVTDAEIKA